MKQLSIQFMCILCSVMFAVLAVTTALETSTDWKGVTFRKDSCTLPPEPGQCRGHFPSFYYDAQAEACMPFIYGGCGGNENRFSTERECQVFRRRCLGYDE